MKNTLKTLLTTTFLTLPTILGSDLHSVATQDEVATTESVVGLSRRVFKLKQKGNIRGAATVYYESVCRPDANLYDFIFTARMIEELGCGDIAIQVFEQLRENANTKIYASYAAGEILRLQSQVLPSLPQVGLATKQDDAESMETSSEDGDKAATETDGLSDGNGSDAELEEADTADTVARKAAGTALMEGIKDFQIDSDTLPETIAEQMQYISEALDCQPILSHGQRSEISSIDDKALSLLGNLDPVTAISILCYSANIEIFMEYIPVLRERFYKFFELIRTDVALNKDERAKTLAVIEALCSKLSQSGSIE